MGLIKEFKEFATRGNVVDLAVGVIIGAAFTGVVNSLVTNVLMPPIGWMTKGVPFNSLSVKMPVGKEEHVEIFYGKFLDSAITFIIIAFCVFLLVKTMNTVLRKQEVAPPKPTRSEELLMEIRDELKSRKV